MKWIVEEAQEACEDFARIGGVAFDAYAFRHRGTLMLAATNASALVVAPALDWNDLTPADYVAPRMRAQDGKRPKGVEAIMQAVDADSDPGVVFESRELRAWTEAEGYGVLYVRPSPLGGAIGHKIDRKLLHSALGWFCGPLACRWVVLPLHSSMISPEQKNVPAFVFSDDEGGLAVVAGLALHTKINEPYFTIGSTTPGSF